MKCKQCGVNYGKDEISLVQWSGDRFNPGYEAFKVRDIKSWNGISWDELKSCKKCGVDVSMQGWGGCKPYWQTNDNLVPYWSMSDVSEDIESALAKEGPTTVVAENSKLVGLLWGYRKPEKKFEFLDKLINQNSFYLGDVAVSEDRRKEGIGRKLCKEFEQRVRKVGGEKIFLRTQKDYPASNRLFESQGYMRTGIFDPGYPDREYFVKSLEG